MYRLVLTLWLFCICSSLVSAQTNRKIRLVFGGEMGALIPFSSGKADPDFLYSGYKTRFVLGPSATYFFRNNIGITAMLDVLPTADFISSDAFNAWDQRFANAEGYYQTKYPVYQPTSEVAFHAGVAYKLEYRKWLLVPRIMAGVMSVETPKYTSYFKLKDSNELIETSIVRTEESSKATFSMRAGMAVHYRLSRYFSANVGVIVHHQKIPISSRYERMNLSSGEILYEKNIRSNETAFYSRLSAGVAFTILTKKKK